MEQVAVGRELRRHERWRFLREMAGAVLLRALIYGGAAAVAASGGPELAVTAASSGPALDTVLTMLQQRQKARIQALGEHTADLLGRQNPEDIDREFIETDRFEELTINLAECAQRATAEAVIRYHAAILVGAMRRDHTHQTEPEAISNALAELTPVEVDLLRQVWEFHKRENKQYGPQDWEPIDGLRDRDREFHYRRIERTGLITEDGRASYTVEGTRMEVHYYVPTATLGVLMDLATELGAHTET